MGLFSREEGWIEQERLTAADADVHRIEVLSAPNILLRSPLTDSS